ncbi:MAG: GIY-YIG nuclease family protein [Alphaproteobacteria bacterium]|nr:GIY-YIG nuclease family protein [Alphaproteobacteria bacterium]
MFYVYLLRSINFPERFYVGCTSDLKRRLKEHNDGKSIYTNRFKPWILHGYVAFDSEEKAQKFENFLKTGNGRIFQKKFF